MDGENGENEQNENELIELPEEKSENLYRFSDELIEETEQEEEIQDAVVISEKKIPVDQRESKQALDERLYNLLSNLPEDAANKFELYRLPDHNLAGTFRIPCDIKEQRDPVYWRKTTDPADIYADIQKMFGGGLYQIKAHNNRGYVSGGMWHYVVPDPPLLSPSKLEKDLKAQTEALTPPAPAAPPVVQNPAPAAPGLIDSLGQIVEVVNAVDKIKSVFTPAAPPLQYAPPASDPPPANNLDPEKAFLLEIYNNAPQSEMKNKIINSMIGYKEPPIEQKPSFWQHAFDTLVNGAAQSEGFQQGAREVFSALVQLGTAYVTSKMMPPAPAPLSFPPIAPPAPQPSPAPENVAIPPAIEQPAPVALSIEVPDFIPEINLGDE